MVKGLDTFRDYFSDFTDQDLKNLKIHGVKASDLRQVLTDAYL